MSEAAATSAVVEKLGRAPLLSRLFGSGRQPLRLIAVPRDHVDGDRARGDAVDEGRQVSVRGIGARWDGVDLAAALQA